MDSKKIVNSLIDDIANGAAISQILLKARIIAYNVGDEKFSKLIKNEQQGYSPNDDIPDYRKLKSMVKATFANSWGNIQTVDVHSEMIEDKRIKDLLTFVYVKDSLVQVEAMYNNAESGMVRVQVPVFAYPTIKSLYDSDGYEVHSQKNPYCQLLKFLRLNYLTYFFSLTISWIGAWIWLLIQTRIRQRQLLTMYIMSKLL